MKALVLEEYNKFVLKEVEKPRIQPDEVLVRIRACSICGSDVHGMDGSTGRRIPPVIMGHEAAGIIEQVGQNVEGWKEGDRVTFDSTLYCGECEFCKRGEVNLCDNRRVFGVSCGEYRFNGAFAEYAAVNQRILYKLPEEVSFLQAAMIEPLSIAVHAVRVSNIAQDQDVAVVGTGMIGLLLVQVLAAKGCRKLIAVDVDDDKLALAKRFGATHIVNSKGDAVKEILDITQGRGLDASFEAVGIEVTGNIAIKSLRKGGTAVLVGNLSAMESLPVQAIVTRQLSVLGSCASAGEYDECIQLIAEKKVDVEAFVSASAPLDEGAEWFKRLYAKEPGLMKVILLP
ncbi:MAG: galactitol-1-phosphate 5-dehydrogenase [Clostridia bacterium]|nr:galactitol-1-phosphate 5-dehydrogenase [Clostridia bacterium]